MIQNSIPDHQNPLGADDSINNADDEENRISDISLVESELSDVLAKKQGAVKELRILQEAVRKNREDLKNSEDESRERRKRYECDLAALEKRTDQVRQELELKTQKVQQLDIKLDNKLNVNTSKVESILRENEELKSKVGKLEDNKRNLESDLEHQKEKFQQEMKAKNLKIDALNDDIEDLTAQNEELEKESAFVHQNMSKTEHELKEQLVKAKLENQKLVQDLENKDMELSRVIEECKQEAKTAQEKIMEINYVISGKDQELQNEIDKHSNVLEEKNLEISRLETIMMESIKVLKGKAVDVEDSSPNVLLQEIKQSLKEKEFLEKQLDTSNRDANIFNENISKLRRECAANEQKLKEKIQMLEEQLRRVTKQSQTDQNDFQRKEETHKFDIEKLKNEYDMKLQMSLESSKQKEAQLDLKIKHLNELVASNEKDYDAKIGRISQQLNAERDALSRTREEELNKMANFLKTQSEQDINKVKEDAANYYRQLSEVASQLQAAKNAEKKLKKELSAVEKTVETELERACKTLSGILAVTVPFELPPYGNDSNRKIEVFSKLALLRALLAELRGFVENSTKQTNDLKAKIVQTEKQSKHELAKMQKIAKQDKNQAVARVRIEAMDQYLTQIEELQGLMNFEKSNTAKIRKQIRDKDEKIHNLKVSMNDWKQQTMQDLDKSFRERLENELELRMHQEGLVKREIVHAKNKEIDSLKDEVSYLKLRLQSLSNSINEVTDTSRDAANKLVRQLQRKNRQLQYENMQMRLREVNNR